MSEIAQAPGLSQSGSHVASARLRDYWELTKPRLSLMSVATAVLGYFAAGPTPDLILFFHLCMGTTLAAFGCGVLNQWWEREQDALMERTANRPVASGKISPLTALLLGLLLAFGGVGWMYFGVNTASACLTGATVGLYILAYTPLKRRSVLATEVGAIPGALPPLIGWVAAGAGFSTMGWMLFAVLFAWQLPHFMAISWMCREDYARGGFEMLSVKDRGGKRVALRALMWTFLLIAVSLLPLREAGLGWVLAVVALFLGYLHVVPAIRFLLHPSEGEHARRLFFMTLIYLPVYLGALIVDRFFI
jgi:protoheme IX farnesyltransferase